jgi:hypothetical protein
MGNAYLLLEVTPGASDEVAKQLTEIAPSAVPCAAAVWGPWDVVARATLGSLQELLDFVDALRLKTDKRVLRVETWWIRDDQEHQEQAAELDRLAFVMLRVNSNPDEVLKYVRRPTGIDGAGVSHAAAVLGSYDIATTIRYRDDVALTTLVMRRFQQEGRRLGIRDTLTIASIVGMVYPIASDKPNKQELARSARELSAVGEEFEQKFPRAAREVEAAAELYATGFATECVFRLMRALEAPLKSVAACLGVSISEKQNWGDILRQIETEVDRRNKATPAKWSDRDDQQIFSTMLISLSACKVLWRNPTMHLESNYNINEANEIFKAVRSLLSIIASRMDEEGRPEAGQVPRR